MEIRSCSHWELPGDRRLVRSLEWRHGRVDTTHHPCDTGRMNDRPPSAPSRPHSWQVLEILAQVSSTSGEWSRECFCLLWPCSPVLQGGDTGQGAKVSPQGRLAPPDCPASYLQVGTPRPHFGFLFSQQTHLGKGYPCHSDPFALLQQGWTAPRKMVSCRWKDTWGAPYLLPCRALL